jgi:hypothetical protein
VHRGIGLYSPISSSAGPGVPLDHVHEKAGPEVTLWFTALPTVPPVSNLPAVALREPLQLYRSRRRRYNPLGAPT